MSTSTVSIVIPTVGRDSLGDLLQALDGSGPLPQEIILVDDRPAPNVPLNPATPPALAPLLRIVPGRAAGPATARNIGWRAAHGDWVAFLDDDVLPARDWLAQLADDLAVAPDVAGSQGAIDVPLPTDRRPTDWERSTEALSDALWITADMAYRRAVLDEVGGFDERFQRAYREDSDLAIRVQQAGQRLVLGNRRVVHPVRPEDRWVSVRRQRGNADDALMRSLHGPDWRTLAGAPRGRLRRHALVTGLGVAAALLGGRRNSRAIALPAGLLWLAGVAEFSWRRIQPGPRTHDEVSAMVGSSVLIPPLATYHWVRGRFTHRNARPWSRHLLTRP